MFAQIYKWFSGLYHDNLWDYFAGFDCDKNGGGDNYFILIGIVTVVISAIIALLFYFIRHSKMSGIISWLVVLLVVALLSWGWGYGYSKSIDKKGNYPAYVIFGTNNCYCPAEESEDFVASDDEELVYSTELDDEEIYEEDLEAGSQTITNNGGCSCEELQPNDGVKPQVNNSTFIMFGLSNMIIGVLWFILISIIVKRFSVDCRNTPWKSLWPKH